MIDESKLIEDLKNPALKNKAFTTLLDLYQERLYWHIRKMVVTHENADDVLQNTFIRVFRSIKTFKEKSTLLTWMYRIAYNESLRYLEKNNKISHLSMDEIELKNQDVLTQDIYFDADAVQQKLHKVVEQLSDKQGMVFKMKYFDDLSFKQIAAISDVSENTLKSSYYTAVKLIEEKMLAS